MQAILRPLRPRQQTHTVELLARTGNKRIQVRLEGLSRQVFAVDRFRLFSLADRRLQVAAEILNALPWNGSGPDPLAPPPAETGDLSLIGDL